MSFLLHFNAGTYTNLRADLISRNKIDSVSFDLNEVTKLYEEQFSVDFKVYDKIDNTVLLDNDKILEYSSTYDYNKTFKEYGELIVIKDGYLNYFKKIELKGRTEYRKYDTNVGYVDFAYEKAQLESYQTKTGYPKLNIDYDAKFALTLDTTHTLIHKLYYVDSKAVVLHFKIAVNKTLEDFTMSIKLNFSCEGWKSSKKKYSYYLKDGEPALIEQGADGKFNFESLFPFAYPSNELLQTETQYISATEQLSWHKEIARQILTEYRFGRRTVSFDVPDVKVLKLNSDGSPITSPEQSGLTDVENPEQGENLSNYVDMTSIVVGSTFIISERNRTDNDKIKFVGGSYRETLVYSDDNMNNPNFKKDVPRRYKITNLEYKFNGALTVGIKALEIPYTLINLL